MLGFGLNVNQTELDWDENIKNLATSMFLQSHTTYQLESVLQNILLSFEAAQRQDEIIISKMYQQYSLIWGNFALLNGNKVFVKEIATDGALVIEDGNKTEIIYAGDLLPIIMP